MGFWDPIYYWVAYKYGGYISGKDEYGNLLHTKTEVLAHRFYDFDEAFQYTELGYVLLKSME